MDTTDAPQLIEHVNQSVTFTPNDTKWIPGSARFVAMGIYPKATGAMTIYGLNQGELKTIAVHEKPHGIKCGTFGASALEDRHLATGDYGGVMSVWYAKERTESSGIELTMLGNVFWWLLAGTWRGPTCPSTRLKPTSPS
jgi:hypothetical protein